MPSAFSTKFCDSLKVAKMVCFVMPTLHFWWWTLWPSVFQKDLFSLSLKKKTIKDCLENYPATGYPKQSYESELKCYKLKENTLQIAGITRIRLHSYHCWFYRRRKLLQDSNFISKKSFPNQKIVDVVLSAASIWKWVYYLTQISVLWLLANGYWCIKQVLSWFVSLSDCYNDVEYLNVLFKSFSS